MKRRTLKERYQQRLNEAGVDQKDIDDPLKGVQDQMKKQGIKQGNDSPIDINQPKKDQKNNTQNQELDPDKSIAKLFKSTLESGKLPTKEQFASLTSPIGDKYIQKAAAALVKSFILISKGNFEVFPSHDEKYLKRGEISDAARELWKEYSDKYRDSLESNGKEDENKDAEISLETIDDNSGLPDGSAEKIYDGIIKYLKDPRTGGKVRGSKAILNMVNFVASQLSGKKPQQGQQPTQNQ